LNVLALALERALQYVGRPQLPFRQLCLTCDSTLLVTGQLAPLPTFCCHHHPCRSCRSLTQHPPALDLQATGLAGCTVDPRSFTSCWINYSQGSISIGTGAAGSSLSFQWQDPEQAIPAIKHIGLSCWDKHVSYRNVQLLPPLPAAQLQQLADEQRQAQSHLLQLQRQEQLQGEEHRQQANACSSASDSKAQGSPERGCAAAAAAAAKVPQLQGHQVPNLLQLVMESVANSMAPAAVCHVLQLSELLLPRTQQLYEAAVQLAGSWFGLLVKQHIDELACLSVDVMADILHEPLLVSKPAFVM
jgi:hypothetical protein